MADIYNQAVLQGLDSETTFDYTKICNYIQRFLNRSDPDTIQNIPTFIALAESRLAIDLKFLGGLMVAQFTISPSLPQTLPCSVIVDKPNLWRETKSISFVGVNGRGYIYPRSYEYLQTYLADFSLLNLATLNNFTDLEFYSDINQNNWLFGPYSRDKEYTMEVMYYATIAPLNSTNPTNYWTILSPRALIYGALCEASLYLRSDDRTMNSWTSFYQESIGMLKTQDRDNFSDNATTRNH